MKAALLPGDATVEVVDRPDPTPGIHDVLIRVRASGLCASDLDLYHGTAIVGGENAGKGNVVPGHEAAGDVVAVGSEVHRIKVGDRVAVHLSVGCMSCEYCRAGYINQCPSWLCLGFDLDGGDAEYEVVPEVNCLVLPADLSYVAGALIVDNFGTQYHTQKRLGISGLGKTLIVGIGPMGAAAVLTAKARGAYVIAAEVLENRLDQAKLLGADEIINVADGNALDKILSLTGGRGVEAAIDCSGVADGENLALNAAAKHGRVGFVGECPKVTVSPSKQIIRKELTLFGCWVFPVFEYQEIVRFLLEHRVPLEQTVGEYYELAKASDAFARFDQRLSGKKVMLIND